MQFLFMALFAGLAVLLDQLSKLWTVHNIALASHNLEHWPALQTAFGLSDAALAACSDTLYIPMECGVESLNAGVAASVILWELYRGQ